jgi:hypothetical protein
LVDWWTVVHKLRLRRRERIERLVKRAERLVEPPEPRDEAPTGAAHGDAAGYGPADVAAVRALTARRDLGIDLHPGMAPPVARGGLAYAVLDAVPHWLAAEATPDIRHVRAPTREMLTDLRLPYTAQSLWFGAPADAGPARDLLAPPVRADLAAFTSALQAQTGGTRPADDSDDATDPDMRLPEGTDEGQAGVPWELAAVAAPLLSERKAGVVGLVLLADEEGRRSDVCCWILWVPDDDGSGVYVPLPARRRLMRNPALVDVAAALVAWGGWEVHETSPPRSPEVRPTTGTWIEPPPPPPLSTSADPSRPADGDEDDAGPIRVLDRGSRIWIEGWKGFHIHHALLAGAPVAELARAYGLSFGDLEATWHRWAGQQQRLRDRQGRPRLSLADYERVFGILTRHQPDHG